MTFIELVVDLMSWVLILGGSGFLIIGAAGIIRFPDFWSRLHAAAVVDSAGMALLLLGMILQGGFTSASIKLVLIIVFLFITGPTATHAVANAAYVSGSRPLGDESGVPISSLDVVESVVSVAEAIEGASSKP